MSGGLALTGLRLSHFRSHRTAQLALDARPVAIHGPNGSGKTNLLEAVSLLSPGRGLRRAAAEDLARRPEALGWRIAADLSLGARQHELELRAEPGQSRAVRIDGKAVPQVALGRLARVLWLVPAMDRLWTEAAEGRRRFLDRITLSFEPAHGEAVLAYEKAMRERNRLLRDQQRDPAWYRALEGQMARSGAMIERSRRDALARIEKAQDQAATGFPVPLLSLSQDDLGEEGLSVLLESGRSRDMAAGRSLTGPHRVDLLAIYDVKGMPAAQSSTGEQKALLISLILANARALRAALGHAPILLLDEVAAHLDAARRAALYEEIGALEAQAWMTGTEPGLFDGLAQRGQYVEIDADGALHRAD